MIFSDSQAVLGGHPVLSKSSISFELNNLLLQVRLLILYFAFAFIVSLFIFSITGEIS
jgi:hypothetical protein